MSNKDVRQVSFHIVTWNVSTKFPDNVILNDLLNLEKHPEHDSPNNLADFYVVGLQEVNSQPHKVVSNIFRNDPWTSKFSDLLKLRDYVIVKSEQMQGLLLTLFAKRKHLLHLRDIDTTYTRTGLGGIWGNKGAVSIRLNVYDVNICIVNAHLAAHDNMLEERINDYNKIVQDHKYNIKIPQNILMHDYVFWFGDLNFRLIGEATTTPQNIRSMIEKDQLNRLTESDQLRIVMREKRAFGELTERLPEFPPTFKFQVGTNEYDMKRRPAWTDRILHKVSDDIKNCTKLAAEQKSYKSHPNYNISDHKPVTSEFTLKVIINDRIDHGQIPAELLPVPLPLMEFYPIGTWYQHEENIIMYLFREGFEEQEADWVGIYEKNFTSLSDYINYEYTSRGRSANVENREIEKQKIKRKMQLTFPETINLDLGRKYQLLYFQSNGTRGVTSLVGMSDLFTVGNRLPSQQLSAEID